jgi:hypothetical protein
MQGTSLQVIDSILPIWLLLRVVLLPVQPLFEHLIESSLHLVPLERVRFLIFPWRSMYVFSHIDLLSSGPLKPKSSMMTACTVSEV